MVALLKEFCLLVKVQRAKRHSRLLKCDAV